MHHTTLNFTATTWGTSWLQYLGKPLMIFILFSILQKNHSCICILAMMPWAPPICPRPGHEAHHQPCMAAVKVSHSHRLSKCPC